jgi:hypothetical protein
MSTLSFQDYVRQRMLKRREAQMAAEAAAEPVRTLPPVVAPIEAARARHAAAQREAASAREVPVLREEVRLPELNHVATPTAAAVGTAPQAGTTAQAASAAQIIAAHNDQVEMMSELRSMRGLIEQRFGALAFMEKLQRHPRQAQLSQKLLDAGFSPALIRKLVESLPMVGAVTAYKVIALLVGLGGLLVIGGSVSGIVAIDRHAESDRLCGPPGCTADGAAAEVSANRYAWGANIGIGLGLVSAAIGTYFVLTGKPSGRASARPFPLAF